MNRTATTLSHTNLYFTALYAETFANGIYCVLFVLCLIKLARDNSTPPRKSLKVLLLCLIVVMFCIGTAHSAIFLQQALSSVTTATTRDPRIHARYEYIKLFLEVVNCFLGDLIIISTALTLEKSVGKMRSRSRSHTATLYAVPALLLVASLVAGIGMVCTCHGVDVLSSVLSSVQRGWPSAWISLVLATNVVSTLVFVYEFLSRWKELKADNMIVVGGALKEFFVTLMCSGALYCCTFIVLFVLFTINSNVRYIVNHMIPQLAGIYPTATIVIVAFSTNDPSIQLTRTLSKSPSRQRFDGLPQPASPRGAKPSQPSSPTTNREVGRVPLQAITVKLPTPAICSPQRALKWCRSMFPGSPPSYPRRGSEASVQNSIHVHIQTFQQVDELCPPKRMTSPSLPPLNTQFGATDSLETFVAEPFKRRSIKWAGQEEDEIPPLAKGMPFEDGANYQNKAHDDGSKSSFFRWWQENPSAITMTSFTCHHGGVAEAV